MSAKEFTLRLRNQANKLRRLKQFYHVSFDFFEHTMPATIQLFRALDCVNNVMPERISVADLGTYFKVPDTK
jgi:hypothetical protein